MNSFCGLRLHGTAVISHDIRTCHEGGIRHPTRDLLYLWLATPGTTAASTKAVSPGAHADFDREGTLIGLEGLDASDVLQDTLQFEVELDRPTETGLPADAGTQS